MTSEKADNAAEKQGIRGKEHEKPREPVSPRGCRVWGSPKPWPLWGFRCLLYFACSQPSPHLTTDLSDLSVCPSLPAHHTTKYPASLSQVMNTTTSCIPLSSSWLFYSGLSLKPTSTTHSRPRSSHITRRTGSSLFELFSAQPWRR